jgi:serine/threonine protein kinase
MSEHDPKEDVRSWYEAHRRDGVPPSIESALGRLGPAFSEESEEYVEVLCDLIRLELDCRRGDDERPTVEEYRLRFPRFASWVDEIFAEEQPEPRRSRFEPGEVLGERYQIRRFEAEGGMSEVYVAADKFLNDRLVAVKVAKPRTHTSVAEMRRRLEQEASIAAGLEHRGIVSVYDVGHCSDGEPFCVMQLISRTGPGEAIGGYHKRDSDSISFQATFTRLEEAIDDYHTHDWSKEPIGAKKLAMRELLRHVVDASNAVGYAHRKGVLHRDLKPKNIMIDDYGQTKVVDWGLAKQMEGQSSSSMPRIDFIQGSSGMGTPQYMSPEQAGRKTPIEERTDVYGLGATLYHVLTGLPPIERQALEVIYKIAREGVFTPPRKRNRIAAIPKRLEAICLKAMALNPEDRYLTCELMAKDLERWLADESVSAYREYWSTRAWHWTKRHRTRVVPVVAAALFAVASIGVYRGIERRHQERLRIGAREFLTEANRIAAEPDFLYDPSRLSNAVTVASKAQSLLTESDDRDLKLQVDKTLQELSAQFDLAKKNNQLIYIVESRFINNDFKDQDDFDTLGKKISGMLGEWPNHPEVNMLYVEFLRRKGNHERTREFCLQAANTKINPSQRLVLATTLGNLGFGSEAIEVLRKLPPESPEFGGIMTWCSAMLACQGRWDEAMEELRMAIRKAPTDPILHDNLARLLNCEGRYEEAAVEYENAAKLAQSEPAPKIMLARFYRFQGKMEASLTVLESMEKLQEGRQAPWRTVWQRDLEAVRELVHNLPRLPEYLQGQYVPKDDDSRLAIAELCYHKELYGKSAEIYIDFIKSYKNRSAKPVTLSSLWNDNTIKMNNGTFFNLMFSSMALAGLGEGKDSPPLGQEFRGACLTVAMELMEEAVAGISSRLETTEARSLILQVKSYQSDPNFVKIRKLTRGQNQGVELSKWLKVWSDIDDSMSRLYERVKRHRL